MKPIRNEKGSVLIFVTLMIVLLMIMVGLGLDTGHLAYVRSQGQPAVDAAALAAASALPTGSPDAINERVKQLNFVKGTNDGGNNYLDSPNNLIDAKNVTLIKYNNATGNITAATGTSAVSIGDANGVRVALEATNPYGGSVGAAMKSPLFLTPLFNLFGQTVSGTQNVSVSAVAIIRAIPGMPIAIAGCAPTSAGCTGGAGTEADPYTNCKLLQVDSSNNGNSPNNDHQDGKYQDSGWTTFNVPSANAPAIKALVGNSSTCANIPPVSIGSGCIYLNNGQITPILTEFEKVYKHNGDALSVTAPPYASDWGIVPVVSPSIGNFNQCEPVISFAKYGIRNVVKDGQDKYLLGDLICNWDINRIGGTGCYTTVLVRDKKSGM